MDNRIIIIDGNSLVNRAYFAMRPMITKSGLYTQAVFGFLRMFDKIKKDYPSGYVAVAFDMKAPTFRHKEYDQYKAGRKSMPPELSMQMPVLKDVLDALKVKRIEIEGYEADDIIGTIAKRGEREGLAPLIISGDKDELQLCTDMTKVLITKKGISEFEIYDYKAMVEKYGFTPTQFVDYKGLMGDTSDNIPGLPGVGPKTATNLMLQYGSVESVIDHVDELKGKLKETVETYAEQAKMSKWLATIVTDVPMEFDLEDYRWEEPDQQALLEIYKKLEFNAFIRNMKLDGVSSSAQKDSGAYGQEASQGAFGKGAAPGAFGGSLGNSDSNSMSSDHSEGFDRATVVATIQPIEKQMADAETIIIKSVGEMTLLKDALQKAVTTTPEKDPDKAVVLKTFGDTKAIGRGRDAEVLTGAAFLVGEKLFYVDTQERKVCVELGSIMKEVQVAYGGNDIKVDYLRLMSLGLTEFSTTFDTAIGQYVIDPSRSSYDFNILGKEYFAYDVPEEKEVLETAAQLDLLSDFTKDYAAYALTCCLLTRSIAKVQALHIAAEGLERIYYEVELPLIPVMASMEYIGFKTEAKTLESIGSGIAARVEELTETIYELAGEEFNIKSPQQLGVILFEKMGLPAGKKTRKGYSTSADILEKIMDNHPIIPLILEYRSLTKLQGTYIDGLIPLIREDGRIHAHFNQTVAQTGRISSSDPNLQNIPIRQELGRQIRKAFVPSDDNHVLMGADYSQIELRVLAHMSGDPVLIKAFNDGEDIHRATAANVLGLKPEEITPGQRSRAKAINFGVIYGMSAFGLSSNLQITRKEADAYIKDYFAKHEKVKIFMDEQVARAKTDGYVSTILGRKRYIKEIHATNFMVRQMGERLAMNSPIQGSAADIIKIAMVHIYKALMPYQSNLLLQVHDELIIDTVKEEEEEVRKLLKETMEGAMKLAVEMSVEVKEGETWFALK